MNIQRYKDYAFKVIRSGDITEVYAYREVLYKKLPFEDIQDEKDLCELEDTILKNGDSEIVTEVEKVTVDTETYKRRVSNILAAKRKITRIIQANAGQYPERDKFLTLTFKGEPPERKKVIDDFQYFNKKFKRKYGDKYEYLAVIERGENATKRLHLHIVCFNLPRIDKEELEELWGHGYIYINEIKTAHDIVNYVTKYIEKTLKDDYIGKGERFYFPSQKLKKPEELFLNDNEFDRFLKYESLGNPLFQFEFNSKYVGDCLYQKFMKID
ncbi:rolling circle replication-associated protein [Breznakia pachnodae]|uniref:Replication-associated protein ORF2/G2P domain-containing protein n=1 Tax=Breznakia pachnodae TaxID=265178 RepID=A0ABU0DZB9_9FIRM|nr:hypothetical protein [Breznakia pachnodae]MDQ0359977.1 hypothetical protein [Breznakia pachnodae]